MYMSSPIGREKITSGTKLCSLILGYMIIHGVTLEVAKSLLLCISYGDWCAYRNFEHESTHKLIIVIVTDTCNVENC